MAAELPIADTDVWMTDVSSDALDVARANTAGLGRRASHVHIVAGNWFEALPDELMGTFDVIVSNPPYIADDDVEVEESVLAWEPESALLSGPDGLRDIREIVHGAGSWLAAGGWLIVEMGHRQAADVVEVMTAAGFADVQVGIDLAGRDRYVEGRWTEVG
jgi:release factor glutamine methyltransferase